MVCAFTNKLILLGEKLADGLILCYPALSLDLGDVQPSLFKSKRENELLSSNFLITAIECYLGKDFQSK